MNFFTVGFLLANLQLDLGLWVGYAIKLAGGLFMLGGIAEMSYVDEGVKGCRPPHVQMRTIVSVRCSSRSVRVV